jgi:hypothetical protein
MASSVEPEWLAARMYARRGLAEEFLRELEMTGEADGAVVIKKF